MRTSRFAFFAAALAWASPALGCMPFPDPPTWEEWIWASSPIFVGTVIEVKPLAACETLPQARQDNVCVVLSVDDDIRGGLAATHEVEQYTEPETSCDRSVPFEIGERWLLVDDSNGYPSERLSGKSEMDIAARAALVRTIVQGPKPVHPPSHTGPGPSH
jgi:hypothetical protein